MGKAKTKQHLAYTILFLPPAPQAGGRARRGRVLEAAGPDVVPSMLGARRGVQEEELNGGQGEEQVLGGGVRWARPAEEPDCGCCCLSSDTWCSSSCSRLAD